MKNLFSYARVSCNVAGARRGDMYRIMALNKLHPLDAIKVVTEQYLLAEYLDVIECHDTSKAIRRQADALIIELPGSLNGNFINFNNFYKIGLNVLQKLSSRSLSDLNSDDIINILEYDTYATYDECLYTATIPTDLIYQILNVLMGCSLPDREDGICHGYSLYAPAIRALKVPFTEVTDTKEQYKCVVDFFPISTEGYRATLQYSGLLSFISAFDLSAYSAENLVTILSNFSIERYIYNMEICPGNTANKSIPFQDACFDYFTAVNAGMSGKKSESNDTHSYLRHGQIGTSCRQGLQFILSLLKNGKLHNEPSYSAAFSAFVSEYCNCPDILKELKAYSTKVLPATESYELKLIAGLEADDEDEEVQNDDVPKTEDTSDTSDTESTDEEDDSSEDMDFTTGDETDTDTATESDTAKPDHRPAIEHKFMLLELGSPVESLSDFLYRDLVSRRISYILKNPPENARPDVLELLKTWKNQWLFIVSIPTIRDFLSKIAIRIS